MGAWKSSSFIKGLIDTPTAIFGIIRSFPYVCFKSQFNDLTIYTLFPFFSSRSHIEHANSIPLMIKSRFLYLYRVIPVSPCFGQDYMLHLYHVSDLPFFSCGGGNSAPTLVALQWNLSLQAALLRICQGICLKFLILVLCFAFRIIPMCGKYRY